MTGEQCTWSRALRLHSNGSGLVYWACKPRGRLLQGVAKDRAQEKESETAWRRRGRRPARGRRAGHTARGKRGVSVQGEGRGVGCRAAPGAAHGRRQPLRLHQLEEAQSSVHVELLCPLENPSCDLSGQLRLVWHRGNSSQLHTSIMLESAWGWGEGRARWDMVKPHSHPPSRAQPISAPCWPGHQCCMARPSSDSALQPQHRLPQSLLEQNE